ncbi:MAG: hypothetical protein AAB426_14805 [Myxococcota bacterium]
MSASASAPEIDDLWLVGQLTRDSYPVQSEDPWLAVLGVHFRDREGDLRDGKVRFYMGGDTQPSLTQDLQTLLLQSGVPVDALDGELWASLRFAESTPDGTRAHLGVQLEDAAGHDSNCYTLELAFDVRAVSAP